MATITFLANGDDSTPSNPQTFAGVTFGTVVADRVLVAALSYEDNSAGANPVTAVTIGGVTAANVIKANTNANTADIWYAEVPTGATGDIVITSGADLEEIGYALYHISGAVADPTDFDSDANATSANLVIDQLTIPTSGVAVFAASSEDDGADIVWTNATEDVDVDTGLSKQSAAHASIAGTPSVTIAQAGTNDKAAVGAAWAASGGVTTHILPQSSATSIGKITQMVGY